MNSRERVYRNNQMNIYLTIKCLHLLFEIDDTYLKTFLSNIKDVASIFVDIFNRRDVSCNQKGAVDKDLLENINNAFTDENFESQKYNYQNIREFMLILLRILATKFSQFQSKVDQQNILDKIFLKILEIIPDFELKIEIINLMNCLFLSNHIPFQHLKRISLIVRKILNFKFVYFFSFLI